MEAETESDSDTTKMFSKIKYKITGKVEEEVSL